MSFNFLTYDDVSHRLNVRLMMYGTHWATMPFRLGEETKWNWGEGWRGLGPDSPDGFSPFWDVRVGDKVAEADELLEAIFLRAGLEYRRTYPLHR